MPGHLVPRRNSTPPERSPEERARAAAERAARKGDAPPPPPETFLARRTAPPEPAPSEDPFRVERTTPAPAPPPEPEPPAAVEPEPESPPAPEPAAGGSWFDEPEPDDDEREVHEPELPEPASSEPRRAQASAPPATADMPADPFGPDEPVADPQATQEFRPAWADEEPPPPPPRRTATAARARRLPPRGPSRPLPRGPRRPPPPRANRGGPAGAARGRSGRRVLAVVALALIAGALWLIYATFQPFHDDGKGAVAVSIPTGADAGKIGEILAKAGVVDSARLFEANATLTMRRGKLRPGGYQLPRGMSNGAAIEALMQGPKAKVVKTFSFTIPEGRSRRENIPLVDKGPFTGDYGKATQQARFLRQARRLGAPRSAHTIEGFLFPATYQMLGGASASDLVARQLDAFRENFAKVDMGAARRRNLTRYDVLTIASMVEREAQLARERPLIAAVIVNRLKQGIPLGIDATIRYQINNWSRPLRVSELERDTPYNTRTHRGLPPTPIGNPGLSSLRAAANPAKTDYLFFVRKPGKTGEHAFSSTDRQFERDVARYQSSRGGP
jgi:UPF0755 protein